MPRRFVRLVFLAGAIVSLVDAGRIAAQEVVVSALALTANRVLGDAALWGGSVELRLRPVAGAVSYHLGGEWSRGDKHRTGVPCAGLIEPGTCAPEAVRDEASLRSASAGASVVVRRRERASLSLSADVMAASVRRVTRGLSSGRSLTAEKRLWGGRLGAAMRWEPWMDVPLALELAITFGRLTPFSRESLVDGYTPLDRSLALRRIQLGAAWRFAGARRQ